MKAFSLTATTFLIWNLYLATVSAGKIEYDPDDRPQNSMGKALYGEDAVNYITQRYLKKGLCDCKSGTETNHLPDGEIVQPCESTRAAILFVVMSLC